MLIIFVYHKFNGLKTAFSNNLLRIEPGHNQDIIDSRPAYLPGNVLQKSFAVNFDKRL